MATTAGRDGSGAEFDAVLLDGTLIHLRPPVTADRPALADLHDRLSRRSAYLRFFSLSQQAPSRYLDRILAPDERDLPGLVALIGGTPVALASYERLEESDQAEVAFLVDDAHQGLGISTLLLETLAADATRRGITRFTAEVLPENEAMLDVFSATGFVTSRRFREGTVRVEFPLSRTAELLEAVGERERQADARSISRLLAPSSVAVLGSAPTGTGRSTGDTAELAGRILANLSKGDFAGPVHAVRPGPGTRFTLPSGTDLAIVTVAAADVLAAVESCAEAGVRNVVVTSGGFSDAGAAGAAREAEVVHAARRAGMRLVGPHCLGMVNTAPEVRLWATPTATCPRPGAVGVLSHSVALGAAMLGGMTRRDIGVSSFVSAGNTADVSGNDLLLYWEQDPATAVVVLYLERFGNPRKFTRIARRLARSKPVLVVASAPGGGALGGGGPAAFDALFRQSGVIRVDRVEDLFPVLQVLLAQPLPGGQRLAVLGNSAAAGALAARAAVAAGLTVAALDPDTQQHVRAVVGPEASVANPVDLLESAGARTYASVLTRLLDAPEVDAVLVSSASYPGTSRTEVTAALRTAARHSVKPVVASLLGVRDEDQRPKEGSVGRVPAFAFPETAARALGIVADYAGWLRSPVGAKPALPGIDPAAAARRLADVMAASPQGVPLDWAQAERLLTDYGIRVEPAGQTDPSELPAWTIGVVQDPLFGPLISFGAGGLATDLYGDIAHHVLPLTDTDAAHLVRSLRSAPLLSGYAGRPLLAVGALEELLLRVAQLAENHREVSRLSLDPVVVTAEAALVGDVTVQVAPAVRAPSAWQRRLR